MTLHQVIEHWRARRDQYRQDGALVVGEKIAALVVADLEAVLAAEADTLVTLAQASAESGFSADYLGRLVRSGKLTNYGRKNAPRVAMSELAKKPGYLRPAASAATVGESKRRTALSVISAA